MNWTAFGQFLLSASPVYAPILIALLAMLVKAAFERLPSAQQAMIATVVSTAVNAVEQVADPNATPAQKKADAINRIEAALNFFGLKNVPASVVDSAVEQAVLLLNMAEKKMPGRNAAQPTTKQGAI